MERDNIAATMLGKSPNMLPETVLDVKQPGETALDVDGDRVSESMPLNPGQTIARNYVVINRIGEGSSQANVYVVRREGRQYAVKMYNHGYEPSEEFVKSLKNHECPYVAGLHDYGYENDSYFEIYQYYANGTLEEKGKCSLSFIKDVVVPSLNEGLYFLHTIGGKGIVHGDIKPRNIFIADDESRVIIGDFGISSYLDNKGRLIDEIKGTPEYAPRTVSFFGKVTKTPAYDYGSLGLVLIRLATGYSLFGGLGMAEITQMWEDGLTIPQSIDSRLRRLIAGLLVEDETRRFGYEDVKKWCEGEFVRIIDQTLYSNEDFEQSKDPDPLIFGIFENRIVSVSTLKELADAITENWDHTKKQMQRSTFYEFLGQVDKALEQEIREISKMQDPDAGVFYALYRIYKSNQIVYKGVNYGTAKEFIDGLKDNISEDQSAIIKKGLFEYFLRQNGYDSALIGRVHRVITMEQSNSKFIPQMLYYLFNREKQYTINGRQIDSLEEFIDEVVTLDADSIERLTGDSKALAWLYSMGFQDDILKFFEL